MLGRLKSVFSKVRKNVEKETKKPVAKKEKKPSFVSKLNVVKNLEKSKLKKIIEELEEELLTNNVAYSVTEELKETIKDQEPIPGTSSIIGRNFFGYLININV